MVGATVVKRSRTSRIHRGCSSSPSSESSGVTFGAETSYFSDGTSYLNRTPPLGDARDLSPPPGVVAAAPASLASSGSSAFVGWAFPMVRRVGRCLEKCAVLLFFAALRRLHPRICEAALSTPEVVDRASICTLEVDSYLLYRY